ncbi:hypothetical protein ACHHYP_15422 [Achlya hypogyna]|uniref:Protein kinase domain-containing protein n=1 Tax=Achlya hypogyna TaxID=1202772 RepID=A0A1V9ZEV7_ACHHY|nr:hypothetical protein ACHHYP_15422 [Achlya hypogyna]
MASPSPTAPMNLSMLVFRAINHHSKCREKSKLRYMPVHHSGPGCAKPCVIHMPDIVLPLDHRGAALALRDYRSDAQAIIGRCRCGYVCNAIYFHFADHGDKKRAAALKVMSKELVKLERDDIDSEMRIMVQLQSFGFDAPRASRHIVRWETAECPRNYYILTEYVANGSLSSYMHKVHERAAKDLLAAYPNLSSKDLGKAIGYWMLFHVALPIFGSILKGLVFLHTQDVCHLDIDPFNVAIRQDREAVFIDFGSSQLLDGRMLVGAGRHTPAIKAKVTYRSPELKSNARARTNYINFVARNHGNMSLRDEYDQIPQGFDGRASDLYSTGVMGFEILLYGFQFDGFLGNNFVSSASNPMWHSAVLAHHEGSCAGLTCVFCLHGIQLPSFAWDLLVQIIGKDPRQRGTSLDAARRWEAGLADLRKTPPVVPDLCHPNAYARLAAHLAPSA